MAIGFAVLLGLGLLVSVITMTGLRATVERADASQASALEVRAAVRSLRADYLESGDAIARILLDPTRDDAHIAKRESDDNAAKHLASAEKASRRADLRALLDQLRRHDAATTDRIENKLLALAAPARDKARRVYLTHYLGARTINLELVGDALQLASDEVAEAGRLTQSKASSTLLLTRLMLAIFLILGLTSGILLSHEVSTVARRFEEAAGEVTEQRDHLQAVMTAMQDSLIVVDGAGTVTTLNDGTCQLLGRTREEIVGQPIARFVETAAGQPIAPTHAAEARSRRMTYRARSGEAIPVSASAAALRNRAGGAVGMVCVAHDMRDHDRMLAEVASARDAALEGSRIKSEFLANVSHEIRTPMNVIIGYTDIVMESELEAVQRESLGRARNAAVALLDIINDVLDISKVEAGKLTVERVPFDLRTLVGDIMESLMLRAQEKGLGLECEIAADVAHQVTGDPTRLRQVLLNLVSNAIKFTERGEVTVEVAREPSAEAGMLRFSVRDTGIGIPSDKQEIIFHAFTQADGSMSRRFGGTGLGLTIAARLVGLMGGRIWVESTVGRGSTFHFTLQADLKRDGLAA